LTLAALDRKSSLVILDYD